MGFVPKHKSNESLTQLRLRFNESNELLGDINDFDGVNEDTLTETIIEWTNVNFIGTDGDNETTRNILDVYSREEVNSKDSVIQQKAYSYTDEEIADHEDKTVDDGVHGLGSAAKYNDDRYLHRSNNLDDVGDVSTSRDNLGLGSAATEDDDRYLHRSNNLSDVNDASESRDNLDVYSRKEVNSKDSVIQQKAYSYTDEKITDHEDKTVDDGVHGIGGASGTFTSSDGKTITVENGLITDITDS